MGDRIVTSDVFRRLYETHVIGAKEADLTLLTAIYEPPKNLGKGRIVRDESDRVIQIVEQRDIDIIEDIKERYRFDTIA
jgi:bifunctional N-acetylglucosamine-1-phosphate-uridyltransferase/glucosamine-1-phosphate-acetyltransferase GlmU-like protein